jgi:hypothetical protein
LPGIVEDLDGAERLRTFDVPGADEGRDLGAQVAGELDGRRADRARGAVHEHARAGVDAGPAEEGQGGQGAIARGGRLLEGDVRRLVGDARRLPCGEVLGMAAEPLAEVGPDAKDLVADREAAYVGPDLRHRARELVAEDPRLRPPPATDSALDERRGAAPGAVVAVDRRGMDPDQDLVGHGYRTLDLLDPQELGRAVPVQDDSPHALPPRSRRRSFAA